MTVSLVSVAAALSLTMAASPGFVALPITKVLTKSNTTQKATSVEKVSSHPDTLLNYYYQYITSFTLGTPPQQIEASLDTGSSDLWIYSSGASYNYDHSASSTSKYINSDFNIEYVDGTGASGDYYTDELTWGGATVTAQFAVDNTYTSASPTGVFGIALKSGEATSGSEYDNYPYALKDAGLIESVAYSLYLDDASSSNGTILFGALDKSRYTGELSVLPLTSDYSFQVTASVYGEELQVILDAGTSLTYLPDDLVATIASDLGATYDFNAGAYAAPRTLPDKGVTYTFGNTEITVPKSELWNDLGTNKLYLTILPSSEAQYNNLLGDTFLRSAYVVYDLDNAQVGIAQANWSPGDSDYEVITSAGISA